MTVVNARPKTDDAGLLLLGGVEELLACCRRTDVMRSKKCGNVKPLKIYFKANTQSLFELVAKGRCCATDQ